MRDFLIDTGGTGFSASPTGAGVDPMPARLWCTDAMRLGMSVAWTWFLVT